MIEPAVVVQKIVIGMGFGLACIDASDSDYHRRRWYGIKLLGSS